MQSERDDVLAQAAITKYHRLGGLDNRHLFLTVLEAGKSRIRVSKRLVSGEDTLPGLQMTTFLPCPDRVERGTETPLASLFIRALIPS